MAVSILILTYNEENIIEECINSVKDISDDIIVFDSFSTDNTVQIAKNLGAKVYQRKFDNEKKHREASLLLNFKYEWVYNPDADEITTQELAKEILSVITQKNNNVAYDVRFKVMFQNKWIKHSSLYPVRVIRLFKPRLLSFDREINLTYNVKGEVGNLESHFIHLTFNKGIESWFEKHNKYSTQEAHETIKSLKEDHIIWKNLLASDSTIRRKTLKNLSFRFPLRPLLRFIYMYFIKLGFMDGRAGFNYCLMLTVYEYMIVLKADELKKNHNMRIELFND